MTTINSIDARFAQTQVGIASMKVTASVQNLVSGQRKDANVADLSVGTILGSRVNTLRVAVGNAGQAKSLLNTAKGALETTLSLLQKQKALATKASDASLSDLARGFLNQEFTALTTEIDAIATYTNFNGVKLINGSIDGTGASIANVSTTSGLADEQYTLLNARDTSASGTVASGSLQDSHAVVGSNKLYFGAGGGAGDTVTFTIDADALAGQTAAQSVTYAIGIASTAAEHAALFVTAARASTASNFNQFEYTDNGDGSVTVKAREAGAYLNNYRFSADNATSTATVKIGATSGAATSIEAATQASEQLFTVGASTSATDLSIAGVDGVFKTVAANNIADTAIDTQITFGATNGTKVVLSVAAGGGAAVEGNITFAGNTITIGTNAASGTHVNSNTTSTTAITQATAFAAKFQTLSDAAYNSTTGVASSAIGKYLFTSDGSAGLTATLRAGQIEDGEALTYVDTGIVGGATAFSVTQVAGTGINGDKQYSSLFLAATTAGVVSAGSTSVVNTSGSTVGLAATGVYQVNSITIDTLVNAAATTSAITFNGTTVFLNTAGAIGNVDTDVYTTATTQANAVAAALEYRKSIGDVNLANYNFSASGAVVTATRTAFAADSGAEIFAFVVGDSTGAATATNSTTAGVASVRDTVTFGTTVFTAIEASAVPASPTTTAVQMNVGTYNTLAKQGQFIADSLNGNSLYNSEFTFTADSFGTVTAIQKNYGVTSTAGNVFSEGAAAANVRISSYNASSTVGTADTVTFTVKDDAAATLGTAISFTLAANVGGSAYSADYIASQFANAYIADRTSASRSFNITNNGDGTIDVKGTEAGTDLNSYSFAFNATTFANLGNATPKLGTSASTVAFADNTDLVLNTGLLASGTTLGTNKNIAAADLTFDPTLKGALTNLIGTFNLGVGNNGVSDAENNTVQFSVDVGGKTYTSQNVVLVGSSAAGAVSNTIAAGTVLTFQNASGPADTTGAYTNAGFQLAIEDAITLSSVTNSSTGQNSLNSVTTSLQTQLDSIAVNSNRSIILDETDSANSDHTLSDATDTILEGIRGFDAVGTDRLSYNKGDISLTSNLYSDTGTHGRIGQFTIDSTLDTISTTIDGETFTAYLNSTTAPTTGGVKAFGYDADGYATNGSYSTLTNIITLGSASGNTAKLNFYSSSITDGRVLTIDLKNVVATSPTIDISTAAKQTVLTDALNVVFGVATSDSSEASLSFQVGTEAADSINVTIGSALSADIYQDEDGVSQTLSVNTLAHAQAASTVLDLAIQNLVSLVSTVSASISTFDAAITNNNASIQNADASRSALLDTDYTTESTSFAEARVRVDAATAVLAQINTRAQNLLQLLRQ